MRRCKRSYSEALRRIIIDIYQDEKILIYLSFSSTFLFNKCRCTQITFLPPFSFFDPLDENWRFILLKLFVYFITFCVAFGVLSTFLSRFYYCWWIVFRNTGRNSIHVSMNWINFKTGRGPTQFQNAPLIDGDFPLGKSWVIGKKVKLIKWQNERQSLLQWPIFRRKLRALVYSPRRSIFVRKRICENAVSVREGAQLWGDTSIWDTVLKISSLKLVIASLVLLFAAINSSLWSR